MSLRAIFQPTRIKMRPERELVLCCIREKINETAARRILELLRQELNWPEVVATAIEHMVVPLVFETLRNLGTELTPFEWMDALKDRARGIPSRNLALFAEMLKISKTLRADQISCLSYKGPVLGWLCYRNLARRTFDNLDFCLDQQNVPRATKLLENLGYHLRPSANEEVVSSDPASGLFIFFWSEETGDKDSHKPGLFGLAGPPRFRRNEPAVPDCGDRRTRSSYILSGR